MREKGFTLLELMIAIVILALIASFAGPSVSGYIDKRKVIDAAEAIYSQLMFARSQSISRSQDIGVTFGYTDDTDARTWLMGISNNIGCDVTQTVTAGDVSDDCTLVVDDGDGVVHGVEGAVDTDDLVQYVTSGAEFNNIELDGDEDPANALAAPANFSFNFTRGTATGAGTIYLRYRRGDSNYEMRVDVSPIGRVRICTPAAAGTPTAPGKVPGYTTTTAATRC